MNRILLSIIFLLVAFPSLLSAQGGPDNHENEFVYGINFNTNGGLPGGFMLRYAQAYKENRYWNVGFEIVNVKHPKENKYNNGNGSTPFIPNKTHYLFALRPNVGFEHTLFRKAPDEGVHMNFMVAGGPTIGLTKPYYVNVALDNGGYSSDLVSVPYDPKKVRLQDIQGPGGFLDGTDELKPYLGAHFKSSVTMDFGALRNSVFGVELGVLLEAYPEKIVLMPSASNTGFFSSMFVNFYFGKKD